VFFLGALVTYQPTRYLEAVTAGRVGLPFAGRLAVYATGAPPLAGGPLVGLATNAGGGLGLLLVAAVLHALGWVGVWAVPIGLLGWGKNRLFLNPARPLLWRTLVAIPLLATAAAVTAALLPGPRFNGTVGTGLWELVRGGVGPIGGALLLGVGALGFGLLEAETWGRRGRVIARVLLGKGSAFLITLTGWLWGGGRLAARGVWLALCGLGRGVVLLGRSMLRFLAWLRTRPWESGASVEAIEEEAEPPAGGGSWTPRIVEAEEEERAEARSAGSSPTPVSAPVAAAAPAASPPPIRRIPERIEERDVEAAVLEARRKATPGRKGGTSVWAAVQGRMVLPTLELLDDVPEIGPPVPEGELHENSKLLTETLRDFGVSGRVGEVHPGPVITRYEYAPGPGVRVAQILNRQDDLALKLRASRIRIQAPIPGKAAVGIEVPNRSPTPIFLRRILEMRAFQEASGPLPLALGKDTSGIPVVTELSRMPHLLLAGTTGSGKSVCLNALITSLLMKRTPAELRLLMVDPKMLELPMYNGIPHLLTDVVTDPRLAARTLRWALLEMESRYRVLAARGCRNLQSYNAKVDRDGPGPNGEEKLPYIVIIIDELADLMVTSGKEVEEPIARLAQTARAVGIHLIVATQRPSVDVITGVIKANFPCRIAFQVASRIDSRTIMDQNGAESLLGKGDMLFLPPGLAVPQRVHGAYVSEEETMRLADAWREQGEPAEYSGLEEALTEPASGAGGLGDDPLFEDAARTVVAIGQASASMLQRRLKVGYARAARLVDMLEAAGVVAAQDGSKPRDVLVDEVRLEHVLAGEES
jgi:S-DNA-T family DNA segregation ATPase FtsK/SpoIIIE